MSTTKALQLLKIGKRHNSFVTAPIFYANAEPHIGHAYTAILCDTAHRWNKLKNTEKKISIFSIGTDEHGSKIFRAAKNSNKNPKQFCDEVSAKFKRLFERLNISNSNFIRTTEEAHRETVQQFWKTLYDRGFIYKSQYSGYYSIVDECFLQENEVEEQVLDGNIVKVVKSTKTSVEWVEEENYMFKLSEFREPIKKWILNTNVVTPSKYKSLALASLEIQEDLSISRSRNRLNWGIPVPNDESQTIYVWLDALVNYLTVSGYSKKNQIWPPTCQIIGKDIVKFHTFYWPAFLLAAGLTLPKKIFVHGHWLVDNVKMSKSLGNVIDPNWAVDVYGSDGLRYFLLKNGNPNDDSNFSKNSCRETINSDLVNNIGNLLNRSTVEKINRNQNYPSLNLEELEKEIKKSSGELIEMLEKLESKIENLFDEMMYYKAIELLMAVMKETNRIFQLNQPWNEKNEEKLQSLIFITYESLRIVSIFMQPICPEYANFCLKRLGVPENERNIKNAKLGMGKSKKLGQNCGVFIERLQK